MYFLLSNLNLVRRIWLLIWQMLKVKVAMTPRISRDYNEMESS